MKEYFVKKLKVAMLSDFIYLEGEGIDEKRLEKAYSKVFYKKARISNNTLELIGEDNRVHRKFHFTEMVMLL